MKPVDVKPYISFDVEFNMEKPKVDVGDHVWISKYKIIWKKTTRLKKLFRIENMRDKTGDTLYAK